MLLTSDMLRASWSSELHASHVSGLAPRLSSLCHLSASAPLACHRQLSGPGIILAGVSQALLAGCGCSTQSGLAFRCAASILAIVSSSSASRGSAQAGQDDLTRSASSSSISSHCPVRHPAHRSSSGTPRSAELMWTPHPAHVALPQLLQSHFQHMCGPVGMS